MNAFAAAIGILTQMTVSGALLLSPIWAQAAQPDAKQTGNAKSSEPKPNNRANNAERRTRTKVNLQPSPDSIPGYTIQNIQGFNVIINNEVLSQDTSKFERKPLDVLDLELGTIVSLMPPDAVSVLRRLLIWVEWDEKEQLANGRQGSAEAVYYGGHQLQLMRDGKHPLKAKSVTVLSMLALTREHQPDRESGRCVLLHEIAHAVHNELLGRDNEQIKAAYSQAMQRNLYDKNLYAATNEQEFFAETTCAYFDQLHYYPKTRTDLEKYDPETFRLMQKVWGRRPIAKGALAKNAAAKSGPTPNSASNVASESDEPAKPAVMLSKLDLGRPVSGPKHSQSELLGRPVALALWNARNGSSMSCLAKMQTWDDELGNFGLVTIGEHMTGQEKVEFEKAVAARNITFAITEGRWTNGSLVKQFTDFPLCLVFDNHGKAVYQGSPFDAEPAVRKAVGGALADSLGDEEIPKPLSVIAEALRNGAPPQTQLVKLTALARSKTAPGSEAATALLEHLTANGRKQLDDARQRMENEPVASFIALEHVAASYKGAPLSQEATQLMGKLRPLKPVQLEFQARQGLAVVTKLDTELRGRPGNFDPLQGQFRTQNSELLGELQKAITQMEKSWPQSQATSEAMGIGRKYGVAE